MVHLRYLPVLLLSAASFVSHRICSKSSRCATGWLHSRPHNDPGGAGSGAWTAEQIATMSRLRNEAMNDPYAYSN